MSTQKKEKLTQARLKELLDYDPETGVFTRRISAGIHGRDNMGKVAGYKMKRGYLMTSVDNIQYRNHRLAWLYVYGYFPEQDIDHIDRDPGNNRIKNLREVSRQCNIRNCGNRKNNTSGVKGVSWQKQRSLWMAQIAVNQKIYNLGRYRNFDNAVCARLAAEQCLNWSGCDSNSSAFQYVQKMLQEE